MPLRLTILSAVSGLLLTPIVNLSTHYESVARCQYREIVTSLVVFLASIIVIIVNSELYFYWSSYPSHLPTHPSVITWLDHDAKSS